MLFNNYNKPGRGIEKEDIDNSGVSFFFDVFFRRIWKMITLNLLYVLMSIPAIVISFAVSLYFFSMLISYTNLDVASNGSNIFWLSVLFAVPVFQITGSGAASVAKNYVLRKYVKDTHSWVISDFFDSFRSNFKQGMAIYVVNTFVICCLLLSYIFYTIIWKNVMGEILSVLIIIIAAFFVMMQFYVYQLVSGVELKINHIYKNALMLTVIKLPWNALVMLMTAIFMFVMCCIALKIPILCVALLLVIYFTLVSFTQIFMTNNIMNKYIIEPALAIKSEDEE